MIFFAQSPSPTPSPGVTPEQIEFFKDATTQLTESFNSLLNTINIVSIFIGVLAALIGFFYFSNIREARKNIRELVNQEVQKNIMQAIEIEKQQIERSLQKEKIISDTKITYLLPKEQRNYQNTQEISMLEGRGFSQVYICYNLQNFYPKNYDILVIDFINFSLTSEEKMGVVEKIIEESSNDLIWVIYNSSDRAEYLSPELTQKLKASNIKYIVANTYISLMGNVVDAAQVAYALKN